MFYIYHGYVSPDNYDSSESPVYELTEKNTEQEVIEHYKEFLSEIYDECSNVIYRVIKGTELQLRPVEKITDYKME